MVLLAALDEREAMVYAVGYKHDRVRDWWLRTRQTLYRVFCFRESSNMPRLRPVP